MGNKKNLKISGFISICKIKENKGRFGVQKRIKTKISAQIKNYATTVMDKNSILWCKKKLKNKQRGDTGQPQNKI